LHGKKVSKDQKRYSGPKKRTNQGIEGRRTVRLTTATFAGVDRKKSTSIKIKKPGKD